MEQNGATYPYSVLLWESLPKPSRNKNSVSALHQTKVHLKVESGQCY